MNRSRTHAISRANAGVVIFLLTGSGWAHDPLHTAADREHVSQHAEHALASDLRVDLETARSLVIAFRESGNDVNLDEAWRILAPAIETRQPGAHVLVTAAFVAQSRHEFSEASQLLEQALDINSNNDEAWLLDASISLVRGDTESAAAACAQLRNVPPLMRITCNARVAVANRLYERPLMQLRRILNVTDSEHTPAELMAWSYSVAGDLAVGVEDADLAAELYGQSLAFAERTQVRAALIDVQISQRNYENAWQVLDAGEAALPLLVRRLIVARHLNHDDEWQPQQNRVQREFQSWIRDEDWLHAREMTRFYIDVVDRPELARQLALINLELQREPEDLRLEERTRSVARVGLRLGCSSDECG